jgi:hypothetical protein
VRGVDLRHLLKWQAVVLRSADAFEDMSLLAPSLLPFCGLVRGNVSKHWLSA